MKPYMLRELPLLKDYVTDGGYEALKKALAMKPGEVIQTVAEAKLLGRGGAGFPTATKWKFMAQDFNEPKYIVCNADEGEPGTFKDKPILEDNPHLLIEGMAIAGYATGATQGYIYLRGEYPKAYTVMQEAIEDAMREEYLGDSVCASGFSFHLHLHRGAGAYICGEETALLDSLEGKRGIPRVRPPYPASKGYDAKPTVVNNVETLANVPLILSIGPAEYTAIGSPDSPGPKLFSVSGRINKPGVYEVPMGITMKELIYDHCGGITDGKELKGVIPGGVSTPVMLPESLGCAMDFSAMHDCGSMLGSGAVTVFDETDCMVRMAWRIARFFEHESCGKCTPCREGTGWLSAILKRIERGEGRMEDLPLLVDIARNMQGICFCPLGDSAAASAINFSLDYRAEFEEHIKQKRCPLP